MLKWIDESPFLNKLIPKISAMVSRNRGVPIVLGIVLVIVGFVLQLVNVFVGSLTLDVIQVIFHNVGILSALIGILFVQPLS